MTALDVTVEERSGGSVVKLDGELDIFSAGRLEETLRRLEDTGTNTVVLDLRGLSYIDSSGLSAILAADTRARGAGRRLALVRAESQVQWRFASTGVEGRLELVDDPAAVLPAG